MSQYIELYLHFYLMSRTYIYCGSGYLVYKYIISFFFLVCEEFLNRFYNSLVARGIVFSLDTIEKELISFCLGVKGKENRLVWYIFTLYLRESANIFISYLRLNVLLLMLASGMFTVESKQKLIIQWNAVIWIFI